MLEYSKIWKEYIRYQPNMRILISKKFILKTREI